MSNSKSTRWPGVPASVPTPSPARRPTQIMAPATSGPHTGGTFTDLVSLTLEQGHYLVNAVVTLVNPGTQNCFAVYAAVTSEDNTAKFSGQTNIGNEAAQAGVSGMSSIGPYPITITEETTLKLRAWSNHDYNVAGHQESGEDTTYLVATPC